MKTKKTLGQVIRHQREGLGLTQRDLAKKLGVKASHVAYLEGGMRRPSFSLVGRIATTLGLDKQEVLLLAHPEARHLLAKDPDAKPEDRPDAWERFSSNRAVIAQYNITPAELKILKQVSTLGTVGAPKQFLFVLNAIRHALEDE